MSGRGNITTDRWRSHNISICRRNAIYPVSLNCQQPLANFIIASGSLERNVTPS